MPRAHQGSASPHALTLAADRDPWDQQPGEPNGSYARFEVFKELHPVIRKNMRRVFEELRKHGDDVTTVPTLSNMATLNLWHDRVKAFDEHRKQRAEEHERIATQKWADRVAQRRAEAQLEHLEHSREMRQIGMAALRTRMPEDITDAAALRMVTEAVRMERELLDLDRSRRPDPDHPEYIDNLTQDEVAARLAELVDEVTRRVTTPAPRHTQTPTAAAASDVLDAEIISDGDPSERPKSRPEPAPTPHDPPPGPPDRPALGPAQSP